MQQYLLDVQKQIQRISNALKAIGELTTSPQLGNDQWTMSVAFQVVTIRDAHRKLSEMTPPAELADVHSAILDATADCNHSTDHLASGIDNLNAADLQEATDLIKSCGDKMNIPLKMLQDRY